MKDNTRKDLLTTNPEVIQPVSTQDLIETKEKKPHRFKKGQSGNPAGRPKGSLNKYTKTKNEFIDIFHKAKGPKRVLNMIKKDDKILYRFVKDCIIPFMPKEDSTTKGDTNNYYTVVRFD